METICYNEYGGSDERYWEVDWVLTKEGKPTGMNHLFWKIAKGSVLYFVGKKNLTYLKGLISQVVRVLH